MEIKITITNYEAQQFEFPIEAKIEITKIDKLHPEVPNYSSKNKFFEHIDNSKDWIRTELNEIINKI